MTRSAKYSRSSRAQVAPARGSGRCAYGLLGAGGQSGAGHDGGPVAGLAPRKTVTCSKYRSERGLVETPWRPPCSTSGHPGEARPAPHRPGYAAASGSRAAGTASASPRTSATASRTRSRRSAPSSSSGPTASGDAARPRRLLPAHGRRPDPGHRQGRRDRLPVPRLALGRRRQVQGDPVRQAHPAARPHPHLDGDGAQRPAVRLARRRGQPADRRADDPGDPRGRLRRVDRLDLEHPRHPQRPLPRDRRQRRGHGALLLHPLRLPEVLQERLRGPRRDPVHELLGPSGHGRRRVRRQRPAAASRRPATSGRRT